MPTSRTRFVQRRHLSSCNNDLGLKVTSSGIKIGSPSSWMPGLSLYKAVWYSEEDDDTWDVKDSLLIELAKGWPTICVIFVGILVVIARAKCGSVFIVRASPYDNFSKSSALLASICAWNFIILYLILRVALLVWLSGSGGAPLSASLAFASW